MDKTTESAIDFVFRCEDHCRSEEEMLEWFDALPDNVANLVGRLFVRNAHLIGLGYAREVREAFIRSGPIKPPRLKLVAA